MAYRIELGERAEDWFEHEATPQEIQMVGGWIMRLAEDPDAVAGTPIPALGVPMFTAVVPGTRIAVVYSVVRNPPFPRAVVHVNRIDVRD